MAKFFTYQTMTPFIISLSFLMEGVDSTIINTAIPAMSHSLHADPVDLKIALISYLLSLAIFIPISGWMADKFGAKKIFITALIIFTLSSLWCGFAHDLRELVISRFVQGFGGALGLPVGRLIIVRTFSKEQLIETMNRVVTVGTFGPMMGPVLGGIITSRTSWNWIFWVNIPVGIVAIILACIYLRETKGQKVPPLDKLGFILFGLALAGFSFGLSALSETTANNLVVLRIFLCSFLLLGIYIIHSRRKIHPIVKTDLLQYRTFQVSVLGNLLSRLGFGGVPFLIPLLLQVGLGYSAELSGLLLMPIAIGVLFGKPLFLPLIRLFGYKRFLMGNTLLSGISIWILSTISAETPLTIICFLSFMYGFILTLQYSSMNSLAYADIPHEDLSAATSIMSTLQQMAQSFGVGSSALFIRMFAFWFATQGTLTPKVFHFTFFAIGFFTLLSTIIYLRLSEEDGQQLISSA